MEVTQRLALHRAAAGIAMTALAALVLGGCGPRLGYEVDLRGARSGDVQVTLRLSGFPRDSLSLRGYGTTSSLRLSSVAVDARGSSGFEVDSVEIEGVRVPRVVVRGPLPPEFTVRYHVTPAVREGDAHVGFTGFSFGDVSERSMFATGRALFVVPDRLPGGGTRIRVRFLRPQGWEVATPWRLDGNAFRPGVRGRWAAEDLLGASLGFGAFDSREIALGRTTYRLAFDRRISPGERVRTAAALERVIRYVHDRLGRDPSDRYTVVVMPETMEGDALAGDGWATGQGGTLSPLTVDRLHRFVERLIDADLESAPNRIVAHDPEERWALDGIRELVAWRAVAHAGLADEGQVERDFAADYAAALGTGDSESLEESEPGEGGGGRIAAPLALVLLERAMVDAGRPGSAAAQPRGRGAGTPAGEDDRRSPLSVAIRAMLKGGGPVPLAGTGLAARSFWASLPARDQPAAGAFRARYVTGREPLPAESLFGFAPAANSPAPPRGPAVHKLVLAFTGNTHGYLENCGCRASQAGGVARRATVLARLRAKGTPLLAIDAGSAFAEPGRIFPQDALARGEQALYLSMLNAMRYEAVAVGETELAQGFLRFRDAARGSALPWLLANVRHGDDHIAPPWLALRAGNARMAVLGLFEPPRGRIRDAQYERAATDLAIEDPLEVLRREYPKMRAHADLVAVVGRLEPATIRRLVAAVPGIDVIVSSEDQSVTRTNAEGEVVLEEGDGAGFVGGTLVLYANLESFGIGSATLGLDAQNRITAADINATWLGDSIPEDPATRASLTRFYDSVGSSAAAQASVPPLFAHDAGRMNGTYVGAAACASCHAAETAQWKDTRHAASYKTLLDVHRHYQPRCVVCHVVGYGTPSGFRIGITDTKLVNVQCEVCHGPGGEHVLKPVRGDIRRAVPEAVCVECHTPDHSDHFIYAEKLPRVVHQTAGAVAATTPNR